MGWNEKTIDRLTDIADQRDLTGREQRLLDQAIADQNTAAAQAAREARWEANN